MTGARGNVFRSFTMTGRIAFIFLAGIALNGCVTHPTTAEKRAEANYLLHFTQFVEWPETTFPDPHTPLVIGILGQNPFGNELARMTDSYRINGHPVVIRHLTPLSNLRHYPVVFIDRSAAFRLPLIFYSLDGGNTLTVSDAPGFTDAGGMIEFFIEDGKVRFDINRRAVDNVGLKMNSQLLIMAKHPPGRKGS